MSLRLDVLHDDDCLRALRGDWLELLARSASNEPFSSPMWLGPWWEVFGCDGGRRLQVITVRDGETLVGLAPLVARRHWYGNALPVRRLEMLGTGEPEAHEICSDYVGPMARRGAEREVAEALSAALCAGAAGGFDELVLATADGSAPMTEAMADALRARGMRVAASRAPMDDAPYIPLPATWEHYLALLSGSRRQFVRRTLRKLEQWAGGEPALHVARDEPERRVALAHLIALHTERWRSEGQAGAFASSRFRAFHERATRELLAAGALELAWLEAHGRPIAALYNVVWNDKVYFYQSGRTVDAPSQVRPAVAIHLYAIRRAIEAGRREYDFLAGMQRFEARLSFAARPLVWLRATPSATPAAVTLRALRAARAGAKQLRSRI